MAKGKIMTSEERSNIANIIQKRVDELTFPELKNQSNIVKNNIIKNIKKELKDYLIRYENMGRIVARATNNIDLDNLTGKARNLQLYLLYKQLLGIDMTALLQDGYILIESLRKTFTGKEIEYEVGMEYSVSKGNHLLINKKISLAELLSFAKVDIDWGSSGIQAFKLRASSNKNDFINEYNKQKIMIETLTANTHSLYPKVQQTLSSSRNKGNVYEVYQQLKHSGWADHSPKSKDPNGLKAQEIIDKYAEVRKGTQSFVSGGDWEMVQFKLLSAAPSIASLGTIGNALKLLLHYLEEGETTDITIENIKKNVFSQEFDKITKKGINELVQDIDELIGNSIPEDIKKNLT